MTIPKSDRTRHLNRLLEIARVSGVQIHFLPAAQFQKLGWDGLYVTTSTLGAGIALRDDLPVAERDWVLAHELGHHFSRMNLRLFSPFAAHAAEPVERAIGPRRPKLDEERADAWAADTLISDEEWQSAEQSNPCDLRSAMNHLGLPIAAGIAWGRQQRRALKSSLQIPIKFSATEWSTLSRSITGKGGHQSFFSRVLAKPRQKEAVLDFSDFSLARERILYVKGGWLSRYRCLLDGIEPAIYKSGGVDHLFKPTFARVIS